MEKPNPIKLKVIKADALVDVKISASFYKLLVETFYAMLTEKTEAENLVILKELATGRAPKDAYESKIIVMIALLRKIEDKATEQGLTEEQTVEPN